MRIVEQKAEVIQPIIEAVEENIDRLFTINDFEFDIHGDPKAAKSTEINRKTGSVYRPKAHKVTVAHVAESAQKALENRGLNGPLFSASTPLRLHVIFYFHYLQSHFGTKNGERYLKEPAPIWVMKKIDIDNMLKPLKDGMKGIIYPDDSQVVSYGTVDKKYDWHGHTVVRLERI